MGADAILREDARHLANIADVSMDEMQRELGVLTRNADGDIARNEIQLAEVVRDNGSIRAGPPVSSQYQRQKEEEAWQRTFTTGTPSPTPSTLVDARIASTGRSPHFGHAMVSRVEGSVASPLLLMNAIILRGSGLSTAQPSKQGRNSSYMTSEASQLTTFEQRRNHELDVVDFMRAVGQPTPTIPAIPDLPTRIMRLDLVVEEYDELVQAILDKDIVAIADGIADLTYVLTGLGIAYGIPVSDVWDEVHANNMTKVGMSEFRVDGKYLKPANWVGPDIAGILKGRT